MQCVNMTDDDLWRRIAQNTTLMSALVYRRLELDSKLEYNYREYTAELRRRYAWFSNERTTQQQGFQERRSPSVRF